MTALMFTRLVLAVAAFAATAALAQFPNKPLTLVVPFAAGGPTDTIGRLLAERMSRSLGQPVIVENVAGATGTIANARVMKGPADGYTVLIGHIGTHVLGQAVQGLNVDYVNEFEPVAMVATNPQVMLARKDFPANDLKELMAYVKANPGKVSYGTGGPGTPSHVMAEYFGQAVGAPLNIVHYKGAAPAMQDIVAGHIDMSFDQAVTGIGHARAGRVKAYAITAKSRLASAPDIPSVDEAGMPGFYMSIWHALWVNKGTPRDVLMRLNAAVREALADPAIRKRLEDMGQEIPSGEQLTPEALRAHHRAEVEKWHPLIRKAGIKSN